jgi:hypothetical protein
LQILVVGHLFVWFKYFITKILHYEDYNQQEIQMKLALVLSLLATVPAFAGIIFSNSADIDTSHKEIKLYDVRYVQLPSKTEIRQIPGCHPNGERMPWECQTEVVLERQPAVVVDIKYLEGVFRDPDMRYSYVTFNLRPEAFSPEKIAELEKVSQGVWDFSGRKFKARAAWAKANLDLQTAVVTRDIQVVDMRNSRFCQYHDDRYPDTIPGCVEDIHYKPAKQTVREVKVLVK